MKFRVLLALSFSVLSGCISNPGSADLLAGQLDSDQFSVDAAERRDFLVERLRDEESFVASCMQASGFDFPLRLIEMLVPNSPLLPGQIPAASSESGYGYADHALATTDSRFQSFALSAGASYQASLSGAAAQEYAMTLHGRETPGPPTRDSCRGKAYSAVRSADETSADVVRTTLADVWQRIEADPQILALDHDWSTCMRQCGFEFSVPREAPEEIKRRVQAIASEGFDPFDNVELDKRRAELAIVRQDEIAVATSDLACRRGTEQLRESSERTYFRSASAALELIYFSPGNS